MERKIFRGVGAVIARPVDHRKFYVVTKITATQTVSFESDRYIEIDLGLTPSQAPWHQVKIDDRGIDRERRPLAGGTTSALLNGYHVTSIGGYVGPGRPDDLSRGCFVGGVYLEDSYFEEMRDRIDLPGNPWPGDGRKTYQLTTIAYSDHSTNGLRRGLRYVGFHGSVRERLTGTSRLVELRNIYDHPFRELELDLEAPAHCEADPPLAPGEVALTTDTKPGTCGAIFVELGHVAALALENPKLPIGLER